MNRHRFNSWGLGTKAFEKSDRPFERQRPTRPVEWDVWQGNEEPREGVQWDVERSGGPREGGRRRRWRPLLPGDDWIETRRGDRDEAGEWTSVRRGGDRMPSPDGPVDLFADEDAFDPYDEDVREPVSERERREQRMVRRQEREIMRRAEARAARRREAAAMAAAERQEEQENAAYDDFIDVENTRPMTPAEEEAMMRDAREAARRRFQGR